MGQQLNSYTQTDLKNMGFSTAIYTGIVISCFIIICLFVRAGSVVSAKDAAFKVGCLSAGKPVAECVKLHKAYYQ